MYLSLCLPTNGISEWVFPALDSIYSQEVDNDRFEVIVTDNGSNDDFRVAMEQYSKDHSNLIYEKTDAYMFDNQLEALKLAKGDYLKFVNHRSVWKEGRLQYMIDFLEQYEKEKYSHHIFYPAWILLMRVCCKLVARLQLYVPYTRRRYAL